jgi:CHAT domain-containing protein/tetratricopeptide (TPR) repeat protein
MTCSELLAVAVLAVLQGTGGQTLYPDRVVSGTVTVDHARPVVENDELATARSLQLTLTIEEQGTYTIELRSYFFDPYLVLLDPDGFALLEDDDGLLDHHSRIVVDDLQAGREYGVLVCAMRNGVGEFELLLKRGKPEVMSEGQRLAAIVEDARRRTQVVEERFGADAQEIIDPLNHLAGALITGGRGAEATETYGRSLVVTEAVFGSHHRNTALVLESLGVALAQTNRYQEAKASLGRALEIRLKGGSSDLEIADTRRQLAIPLIRMSEFEEASALLESAMTVLTEELPGDHPKLLTAKDTLAFLKLELGEYGAARDYYQEVLDHLVEQYGPDFIHALSIRNNVGVVSRRLGDFETARKAFKQNLEACDRELPPEHPLRMSTLNNLALCEVKTGRYGEGLKYYKRSLFLREKYSGERNPETLKVMHNLGDLLRKLGDLEGAETMLVRSTELSLEVLGRENVETAVAMNSLGLLRYKQGRLDEARQVYEEALEIKSGLLDENHHSIAVQLNNLAQVLEDIGLFGEAQEHLEKALEIRRRNLGDKHHLSIQSLHNLANVLDMRGDPDEALPIFTEVLKLRQEELDPSGPSVAETKMTIAGVYSRLEEWEPARSFAVEGFMEMADFVLGERWSMTESEVMRYVESLHNHLDLVLNLLGNDLTDAYEAEAYKCVLRWKRQVYRSHVLGRARIREEQAGAVRRTVSELQEVSTQLTRALLGGSGETAEQRADLQELRYQKDRLELLIAEQMKPGEQAVGLTAATISASLSPGSAFVDFLVHKGHLLGESTSGPVLTAWVTPHGKSARRVQLGAAIPIHRAMRAALETILSPATEPGELQQRNRRLRELIWDPVERELSGIDQVIVSTSGFLALYPLGVLEREDGTHLVEHYSFAHVHSAHDVLVARHGDQPETAAGEPGALLAVGGVAYGTEGHQPQSEEEEEQTSAPEPVTRSIYEQWPELPFSGKEAEGVVQIHAQAHPRAPRLLVSGPDASEARIKSSLPSYPYVHLATHGFHEPDELPSFFHEAGFVEQEGTKRVEAYRMAARYSPGLLSGLALAGVNDSPEGRDDGLLTSEEVSWLDLSECDLVVLSACQTAIGEMFGNEGMISLRRAFRIAGSRTVISSLWSIEDRSTADFMEEFYRLLWDEGLGKGEALRRAQVEIIKRNRQVYKGDSRPKTWGAFVLDGNWR